MPAGATGADVVNWISAAVQQSPELALKNVVINCHGGPGALSVGGVNSPVLNDASVFQGVRTLDIGTIWFTGCLVATGMLGQNFCSLVAVISGADVIAANDDQFVEGSLLGGRPTIFGAIDDFEGTAYQFSPSGSISLYSIHDPLAEGYS